MSACKTIAEQELADAVIKIRDMAKQSGVDEERAAVVEYLRGHLDTYERFVVRSPENTEGRALLMMLVDTIEKGEHHDR